MFLSEEVAVDGKFFEVEKVETRLVFGADEADAVDVELCNEELLKGVELEVELKLVLIKQTINLTRNNFFIIFSKFC